MKNIVGILKLGENWREIQSPKLCKKKIYSHEKSSKLLINKKKKTK